MRERDLAIARCVATFEPVTREQLEELAAKYEDLGAPSKLYRRLLPRKPLIADKHIYYWKAPIGEKYVYASYDISKRKDFNHDLITSWVQIILDLHFDVAKWNRSNQKFKGQVNEDAFFILNVKDKPINYFLESDTGSEPYRQIEEKWERYIKLLGEANKKFFVLFLCATQKRAVDLARRAAKGYIPRSNRIAFLFTYLDAFRDNPTGRICLVPYEEDLFTLLPPV